MVWFAINVLTRLTSEVNNELYNLWTCQIHGLVQVYLPGGNNVGKHSDFI